MGGYTSKCEKKSKSLHPTVQGKYLGLEWRVESDSTKPKEYKYRTVQGKYPGLEWRVESIQYQTNRSTSIGLCRGNIPVWSGGWRVAVP
jgi:hypothetical protein